MGRPITWRNDVSAKARQQAIYAYEDEARRASAQHHLSIPVRPITPDIVVVEPRSEQEKLHQKYLQVTELSAWNQFRSEYCDMFSRDPTLGEMAETHSETLLQADNEPLLLTTAINKVEDAHLREFCLPMFTPDPPISNPRPLIMRNNYLSGARSVAWFFPSIIETEAIAGALADGKPRSMITAALQAESRELERKFTAANIGQNTLLKRKYIPSSALNADTENDQELDVYSSSPNKVFDSSEEESSHSSLAIPKLIQAEQGSKPSLVMDHANDAKNPASSLKSQCSAGAQESLLKPVLHRRILELQAERDVSNSDSVHPVGMMIAMFPDHKDFDITDLPAEGMRRLTVPPMVARALRNRRLYYGSANLDILRKGPPNHRRIVEVIKDYNLLHATSVHPKGMLQAFCPHLKTHELPKYPLHMMRRLTLRPAIAALYALDNE